jgi:hypothetical protein
MILYRLQKLGKFVKFSEEQGIESSTGICDEAT